jgi:glucose/arabinose dehydrogenase
MRAWRSAWSRRFVSFGLLAIVVTAGCLPAPPAQPAAGPEPTQTAGRTARKGRLQTSVYVDNVELPAAMTFAPDGRMFFVEVFAGRVRVVENGVLQPEPVITFQVQQGSESGLLGLALDPDFATNRYVYAYYAEPDPAEQDRGLRNRVVRCVEQNGHASDVTPILDNLPNNPVKGAQDAHEGGALIFGPDGKLYVTIGDVGRPDESQDPHSLAGKVLRVNPDGSIPADNPIPGSPVYTMGLRNAWGLAVHPRTGGIYATDNGNHTHDKVVLVEPGANYGWPLAEDPATDTSRFTTQVWDSGDNLDTSHSGLTGLTIYEGAMFPEFQDSVLFCSFRTGKLRRLPLLGPQQDHVDDVDRLDPECRLGVTVGPDSSIYVSTMSRIVRLST